MLDKGITLLLVSHGTGDVESICQKALWINKGNMVMLGDSKEVLKQYLGE